MIKKIIFSGIVLCLFIAVPLALLGYTKVELGQPFLGLMKAVSRDLNNFKIAIPEIPHIPTFEEESASGGLEVLFNILNVIINFFNMIITLINAVVGIFNVVLQLLECIVLVIKNLITFKDSVIDYNPLPILEGHIFVS